MYRNDHPVFGVDPDLPGGTSEDGETPLETMLREVLEESGMILDADDVHEIYSGTDYSAHGTFYSLFVAKMKSCPEITMSWEHSSYEWLDFDDFIKCLNSANDTYMHMVADILKKHGTSPQPVT